MFFCCIKVISCCCDCLYSWFLVIRENVCYRAVIKREQKRIQAEYDEKIAAQEAVLTIAKEACWLYDKFGEGVYQDVPGLCKIATIEEIEGKGCSLTPGAYVGVKPQEDDGVDFSARMKEIHQELLELQKESNELMEKIAMNLKEMNL